MVFLFLALEVMSIIKLAVAGRLVTFFTEI